MTPIKNESGKMATTEERIDSPSTGDGSREPVVGGDGLKKGPWTSAEDAILMEYVNKYGDGNWNNVQKHSGLSRCGKSCRLRWANHLRPNLKKGTITPEEERLIIQLHSQWGNKWARMAAMLPGRTDNEIKNYWNTRAKRCERTGVALHPPDMCFDASNGNLQSQDVTNFVSLLHKQYNGVMPGSAYSTIPEIRFDNYKANPGFSPYVSYVPEVASSIQGYESKHYGFVDSTRNGFVDSTRNHIKRLRETETSLPGFHGSLCGRVPTCEQLSSWRSEKNDQGSFDPDTNIGNLNPFEIAVPSAIALSNDNVSSSRPIPRTGELELPSFQNNETEISNWIACTSSPQREADSYIQSPLETTSVSISRKNLLEAVPKQWSSGTIDQQAQTGWIIPDFVPSEMLESSALNHGDASWGDHGEPVTPLGNSSGSAFSETPPFSANSPDEFQCSQPTSGSEHMSDALAGPDWYAESYGGAKQNYMLSDVLKELLAERSQFKQMPPETVPSGPIQGSGSECYPSKNPFNQRSGTPSNVPGTCL